MAEVVEAAEVGVVIVMEVEGVLWWCSCFSVMGGDTNA